MRSTLIIYQVIMINKKKKAILRMVKRGQYQKLARVVKPLIVKGHGENK